MRRLEEVLEPDAAELDPDLRGLYKYNLLIQLFWLYIYNSSRSGRSCSTSNEYHQLGRSMEDQMSLSLHHPLDRSFQEASQSLS